MAMKGTDPLRRKTPRVTLTETKTAIRKRKPKRWEDCQDFLDELWLLCKSFGRDFAIYVALAVNETAWFTHKWWAERLNPASIGVPGVPSIDRRSPTFKNGRDAARCFFLLMEIKQARSIPEHLEAFAAIAPEKTAETLAFANFADFPLVRELDDLHARFGPLDSAGQPSECVWACSQSNTRSVIEKAAALWPNLSSKGDKPMSDQIVVFGNVPEPDIKTMICTKLGEGHGFYRVPPRKNVGVCEHITDGRGSIEFYHSFFSIGGERERDALVDFVIGRDGRIAMLNDWRGTRAPWANGNRLGMEGDGPAFYQAFGVAGIDQKLVSIEHEGFAAEDWTPAMWRASIDLDAWLFDQMGVRWDSYPVHQDFGVVTHMAHFEFTNKGGNGPDECPGRYWRQRVTAFQDAVRARMKQFQLVTPDVEPVPPPVDTAAKPFKGFKHGLKTRTDQHDGAKLYQYLERRFKVAPNRKAQKRVAIGKDQLIVDVLAPGDQIVSAFVTRQDDLDWVIDEHGYAYQLNAFSPRVPLPLKPPAPHNPR